MFIDWKFESRKLNHLFEYKSMQLDSIFKIACWMWGYAHTHDLSASGHLKQV